MVSVARCWSGVWPASWAASPSGLVVLAWRRVVVRLDSKGGRVFCRACWASVRLLSGVGIRFGLRWVKAAPNTARPWSVGMGVSPSRAIREWSREDRWAVMPLGVCQ
ncbi:hypothetical protein MSIMFB_03630 [Mycobacterium simulans]|uniref:Uncharacterized protein n=1 Tax=Mycobacterium simulans TaxID=627089 RepID=A0A7Z7NBM6_9MYCO|nr:hypothetical protein MSIMFB_03630 [Mycobacterium simulans]